MDARVAKRRAKNKARFQKQLNKNTEKMIVIQKKKKTVIEQIYLVY